MGLTKEVLSAHTQQEEQAFLDRFKDLSKLRVFDQTASSALRWQPPSANPLSRGVRCSRDYPAVGSSTRHRRGRGGKRLKHQEPSDQRSSRGPSRSHVDPRTSTAPLPLSLPLGPLTNSSSWASVGSQASMPAAPFPPGMLPIYPVYPPITQPFSQPVPDPSRFPPAQMLPPMMAFVLPNYMFPQMGAPIPQQGAAPGHFYNPNVPQPVSTAAPAVATVPNPVPLPATIDPSRSSTPQSYGQNPPEREGAESPLFQSRCSSPLNLLQLEESPSNRLEVATALGPSQQATPSAQGAAGGGQSPANPGSSDDTSKENENVGFQIIQFQHKQVPAAGPEPHESNFLSLLQGETNESNQDAMSTSSDLLDLLLQEDSRSGTGSAASGSGSSGTRSSGSGSGSNGCSSSGTSGTSSSQGSHTSKYFGSIDSSENDHARKQPAGGSSSAGGEGEEQFIKCVLQDPIWLLMANTDDKVMMTYQLPVRDMETVLREDREALRSMQKHQPRFTEDQKRELSQVHPWVRTGRLPRAINISGCKGCKSPPVVPPADPFDVEIHEMELCSVLNAQEDGGGKEKKSLSEILMDDAHPEEEDEEEEAEEKTAKTQDDSQDMPAAEASLGAGTGTLEMNQ
ncbi:unnamed protein product [Tetraodon nigroviridis]|uniref:(spotted green pufferfish) hypothetical protein n=1 Tax=Tetraodon nigroviridis TaxID=99883 RepID=Q4SRN5_TETNG|nr:unnamed protein product [Tetraodon nigroviridis]